MEHTIRTTRQQLKLTEQGQITDRYTKAVDQLGSEYQDVRLGGIYALERIARDSDADRATVCAVLIAFVHGHAPWPPTRKEQPAPDMRIADLPSLQEWAPDVQAAITVLGRGDFAAAVPTRLDLRQVDLRKAELRGLHFQRADFYSARLQGASLFEAQLQGAYLVKAQLQEVSLGRAQLQGADLLGAKLQGAYLQGAQLQDTHLDKYQARGAHANRTTAWPAGFDPWSAGVSLDEYDDI